jgi:hypothetical protein
MRKPEKVNIEDENRLLRRVPFKDPKYIKSDGSSSSFAFTPIKEDGRLSVNIEKLTTYEKRILNKRRFWLYFHQARKYRDLGLECEYDPEPDNYTHALVLGINHNNRKIPRKLARSAVKIDYP